MPVCRLSDPSRRFKQPEIVTLLRQPELHRPRCWQILRSMPRELRGCLTGLEQRC